jgi:hypothetical protein
VEELVDGDVRDQRSAPRLLGAARLQVDDGERRALRRPPGRRPADVRLLNRAVVEDDVLLERAREAERRPEQLVADPPEPAGERGVELRAALERDPGEIERAEAGRAAGERGEVEARRARRVLAAPPGVGGGEVGDDRRGERGEPVGSAGRERVDRSDLASRDRVGPAVARRDVRPAPRNRRGSRGRRGGREQRGRCREER